MASQSQTKKNKKLWLANQRKQEKNKERLVMVVIKDKTMPSAEFANRQRM